MQKNKCKAYVYSVYIRKHVYIVDIVANTVTIDDDY